MFSVRYSYRLSFQLPTIARELNTRVCQFATGKSGQLNFVTIDLGQGVRYAVFFDLMRWKKQGPDAILLMVQSAYALELEKPAPGKGKISFSALLGAYAARDDAGATTLKKRKPHF